MQMPVFLVLFFAPVYVPLNLLHGWIAGVARINPSTYVLETGRGFLAGDVPHVLLAFGLAIGMGVAFWWWAFLGLRRAERAGAFYPNTQASAVAQLTVGRSAIALSPSIDGFSEIASTDRVAQVVKSSRSAEGEGKPSAVDGAVPTNQEAFCTTKRILRPVGAALAIAREPIPFHARRGEVDASESHSSSSSPQLFSWRLVPHLPARLPSSVRMAGRMHRALHSARTASCQRVQSTITTRVTSAARSHRQEVRRARE